MNIVAIDIVRAGDEHRIINMPALRALFATERLTQVYLSDSSTCMPFVNGCPNLKVLPVLVSGNRFYRWIVSSLWTLFLLLTKSRGHNQIVFLSAIPLHYLLISIFSRLVRKSAPIVVFMHGEMGYLLHASGIGQMIGAFCIRTSFAIADPDRTRFLALGYPIFADLCNRFPRMKTSFRHLEIPTEAQSEKGHESRWGHKVRIGSFGIHSSDKNSEAIYDLARMMDRVCFENIELVTIGNAVDGFKFHVCNDVQHWLSGQGTTKLAPRAEFIEHVQKLDWALMFQKSDEKYGLVPSGVFYDCISLRLPLIAMRSKVLEYFFEHFGPLGILCNDLLDFAATIEKIAKGQIEAAQFNKNLERAATELSFTNFKKKLNEHLR